MCDQQSLRSACAYAQSDQSLCMSLEYYMSVKATDRTSFGVYKLKRGRHRPVWIYACQNATLLEITFHFILQCISVPYLESGVNTFGKKQLQFYICIAKKQIFYEINYNAIKYNTFQFICHFTLHSEPPSYIVDFNGSNFLVIALL